MEWSGILNYNNSDSRINVTDNDGKITASLKRNQQSILYPTGWTTILWEDAEGVFPNANNWGVYDDDIDSGQDYWDDLSCRSYAGTWSIWSADSGDQPDCITYDNNMDSWMVYGPFSLKDAAAAQAVFMLWTETERPDIPYDYVSWGVSLNGYQYYGYRAGNNSGWVQIVFDFKNIPTLGDVTGQTNVWFAIIFKSDSTINGYEGSYVDNILIEMLPNSLLVDLQADQVFFRDQPGNQGNVISDPEIGQEVYPHFTYTVNANNDVENVQWEINITGTGYSCTYNGTEPPGSRVGWCVSPWSAQQGTQNLNGEIDYNNLLYETNETNNNASSTYTIGPPLEPDIRVEPNILIFDNTQ